MAVACGVIALKRILLTFYPFCFQFLSLSDLVFHQFIFVCSSKLANLGQEYNLQNTSLAGQQPFSPSKLKFPGQVNSNLILLPFCVGTSPFPQDLSFVYFMVSSFLTVGSWLLTTIKKKDSSYAFNPSIQENESAQSCLKEGILFIYNYTVVLQKCRKRLPAALLKREAGLCPPPPLSSPLPSINSTLKMERNVERDFCQFAPVVLLPLLFFLVCFSPVYLCILVLCDKTFPQAVLGTHLLTPDRKSTTDQSTNTTSNLGNHEFLLSYLQEYG